MLVSAVLLAPSGEVSYAFEILKIGRAKIFLSCPEEGPIFEKCEIYNVENIQKIRTGGSVTPLINQYRTQ